MRIKIEIIAAICLFFGGYLTAALTKPDRVELIKDDRPVQEIIIQPTTSEEYKAAFDSPIIITRQLDGTDLSISASDGYKRTSVKDKLIFPDSRNKTRLYGYADMTYANRQIFPTFGCGIEKLFSALFIGGEAGGSQGHFRAAIKCGISIF